jgi:hypothetical protein
MVKNDSQVDQGLRVKVVLSEGTQRPTIAHENSNLSHTPTHSFAAYRSNLTDPQQTNT